MNEIKEKIQTAILDMMAKVKYVEDDHTYQEVKTGNWLQGVSKISSIVPKDWLASWGAKECVKALGYSDYQGDTELALEMMQKIGNCKTPEEYIQILKEAKGASGRKSKTAMVDGKKGHAHLEAYVKAKIRGTELPQMPADALKRPVEQFIQWETENVAYWILSEARVAYPEKGYAGTLDALAMLKNGRLAVIDFKFASHISEDYSLQTAGYQACFEPYGIDIKDRVIVRLPKTLTKEEWDPETKQYTIVENNIEVVIVDTPYELDRDTFFHCVFIKKWINLVTKK